MSDDNSDKAWGLLGNSLPIVMVALLAAGVLVKYTPLESARPTNPERVTFLSTSQQDVEARLWQDPFAAVEKHKKSSELAVTLPKNTLMMLFEPTSPNTSSASDRLKILNTQIQRLNEKSDDVTVVAVSVFAGPYAEEAEIRRRSRFAVISALGFHDYHPQFNEVIGYFLIDRSEFKQDLDAKDLTVPYEWFEKQDRDTGKKSHVLVLWLNEDQLSSKPLTRLKTLFENLLPGTFDVKLIGPFGSAMMATLVHDMDEAPPLASRPTRMWSGNSTFQVFAPGATISDCDLLPEKNSQLTWDCFKHSPNRLKDKKLPIVRTTGTDDVLAASLLWELWQRGVNRELGYVETLKKWFGQDDTQSPRKCDDGLVLIGERDTQYGRTLLRYLTDGFKKRCGTKSDGLRSEKAPVRTFSYLRGLDGVLADADKSGGKAPPKNDSGKSKDLLEQLDDAPLEHAEGRSQFDYLHRLADEINRLDDDKSFAEHGVKAIGIVGSDLYDKLLILQALRSRFKDKIFFTTDLDARYLHADQKNWARNLVVASNFGLSLKQELQRDTLPFRDSYQTATYLATLMALAKPFPPPGIEPTPPYQPARYLAPLLIASDPLLYWTDKMKEWLHPQIFEIGKTEAVHLASPSVERLTCWMGGPYPEDSPKYYACKKSEKHENSNGKENSAGSDPAATKKPCNSDWQMCDSIEPTWPSRDLSLGHIKEILIILCAFGLLFFALANHSGIETLRATVGASSPERKRALVRIGLVIAVVCVVATTLWWVHGLMQEALAQGDGEPFVLLEGVSVWPSLVIRFAGLVTMLVLWYLLQNSLRSQKTFISRDFKLPQPSTPELKRSGWSAALIGPHLNLAWFDKDGKAVKKKSTEVTTLWQNYLRATSFYEKKYWIGFSLIIGFSFLFAIAKICDEPWFPHRGQLVLNLHLALILLNTLVLWLTIFWVGYETRACTRFIEALSGVHNEWPDTLLKRTNAETGLKPEQLENYLDFQLIVRATQRIEWLIYLPFASILFTVLAQSNFFDAMDFPLAWVIFIGLALTYTLHSAWLLNKRAKEMRGRVLKYYEEQRYMPDASINAEPFDRLISRISHTHEGAFTYVAQQPALQALLLPFGGYGSIQIIEYLFKL